MQTHKDSHKNNKTMVVKNDEKHDYKSIKRPVSTAFRTLYSQVHCLITLHETFNALMLYKDVSELTDLCFKHNNMVVTSLACTAYKYGNIACVRKSRKLNN